MTAPSRPCPNEVYRARVVSPEGRYAGDTQTPPVYAPIGFEGDLFLALVTNPETGERVPTVYRLRPTVPGLDFPGQEPRPPSRQGRWEE